MTEPPDMTEWLAGLGADSYTVDSDRITANLGKTELPDWAGKPVKNENGEVIGLVTGGHITANGDVVVEMRF